MSSFFVVLTPKSVYCHSPTCKGLRFTAYDRLRASIVPLAVSLTESPLGATMAEHEIGDVKSCNTDLDARREFLRLAQGVYLVRGVSGIALYDVRSRKALTVPAVLVELLEACSRGQPFEQALKTSFGKTVGQSAIETIRRFVRDHPALDFSAEPPPEPLPPPLSRAVRPSWLMLEITAACNLQCCHCYISAPHTKSQNAAPTLATSRWIDLMKEGREIGYRSLQFTGGEPLVHPDFAELVRSADELGYKPVAVFSNLTLLAPETVDLFRQVHAQIHTTVYSCRPEIHDALSREPGSFGRVIDGLERVLATDLEAFVAIILMEENKATLEDTIDFLTDMGIPRNRIKLDCVWPQGRGERLPMQTDVLHWRHKVGKIALESESQIAVRTCWAGRTAIAPNGDVFVCVGKREALGNVAANPLRPIAESDTMRSLWRITLDDVEGCRECEFRYACFDCRAFANLLTDDLRGRDPTCPYDPKTGRWQHGEINMDEKPKRKDNLVAEDMDDDVLVADFRKSEMHVLNPTAAAIWEMCDGEHTAEQIADTLAEHFGVTAEEIQSDVANMLADFNEKGLLE